MNEASDETFCPICSGTHFRPYRLGLVQCDECDLVFSPTIWQPQANERLEEEWFGEDYQPERSYWVELFEAWQNRRTLRRLEQVNLPARRLLEIGVGSGSFLKAARERGYDVMGCDLSAPICERVRRIYGISMHGEPLAALAGENRFDFIVMNHVLEHVQQPIEFLQHVRRLLTPGGVVHIAVPNVACWEAALPGWTSYVPYHLTYFDPQTLKRTVAASGLTIAHITTHDSLSGWFLAVLRTVLGVNKQGGAVTRPASTTERPATDRRGMVEHVYRIAMVSTGAALWPLRAFQARISRGDETICLSQKPQTAWPA